MTQQADGSAPMPIPFTGGMIDGNRLAEGEIYLEKPVAAVAPPGCEIAERYVALQSAGQYDKVVELFTEDAIFLHGRGAPCFGHEGINQFYAVQIKSLDVDIIPVAYGVAPGMCYVQLAIARLGAGKPEYYSAAIDQFFLAPDGRARLMMPYGRRTAIASGAITALERAAK